MIQKNFFALSILIIPLSIGSIGLSAQKSPIADITGLPQCGIAFNPSDYYYGPLSEDTATVEIAQSNLQNIESTEAQIATTIADIGSFSSDTRDNQIRRTELVNRSLDADEAQGVITLLKPIWNPFETSLLAF